MGPFFRDSGTQSHYLHFNENPHREAPKAARALYVGTALSLIDFTSLKLWIAANLQETNFPAAAEVVLQSRASPCKNDFLPVLSYVMSASLYPFGLSEHFKCAVSKEGNFHSADQQTVWMHLNTTQFKHQLILLNHYRQSKQSWWMRRIIKAQQEGEM